MAMVETPATTPSANALLRTTMWVMPSTPRRKAEAKVSMTGSRIRVALLPTPGLLSSRDDRAGMTVTATISDSSTDTEMATAMSRKSCPTSSSITRTGMNTITVVNADTSTAPQTCWAPW